MPPNGIILSPSAWNRVKAAVRRVELDRGRRPAPGMFGGLAAGNAEHWFVIVQSHTTAGTGATAIPHAWIEAQWSAANEVMEELGTAPHQTGQPTRPRRTSTEGSGTGADPYARPGYNATAPEAPIPDGTLCLCVLQQTDEGEPVWLLWPVQSSRSEWSAKITARSATTNATYSAEAIDDPNVSVSSATPINRLFSTSSFTFNAAAVDDPCLILRKEDDTLVLVILTETITVSSCPA